ncbi:MAG: sigma-70 family RNA polymerase sigma factor [Dehalococcoidales bacterium]|nr:sigma-70 family RNA polymerase sigma factor [Dehalococcoidales bacterium]
MTAWEPAKEEDLANTAKRYLRSLRQYVLSRLRKRAASEGLDASELPADEIVAETFLVALRHQGEGEGDVPSYRQLRRIARGVIRREVTRGRARAQYEVSLARPIVPNGHIAGIHPEEEFHVADLIPDPTSPVPASIVEHEELHRQLDEALAQVPEVWRENFMLHEVDGFSLDDLAHLRGASVEAITHGIEQTRAFLRARLGEEGEDLGRAA